MAGEAFDLMVRHVFPMEEFGSIPGLQYLPLVMALQAGKVGYVSVAGDDVRVTPVALDAPVDIPLVVEDEPLVDLDIAPRLEMAGSAGRGQAAALPAFVKMAYEALHVRDRHVAALHDLGVAGSASKLLLPPHLLDVPGVAEEHVLEDHVVLQIGPLVAAALEAARVIYLRMGSRRALARDEVGEG